MFYYLLTKQELQTFSVKMEFTQEQMWVWYLHAEYKGRRETSERDRGCCNGNLGLYVLDTNLFVSRSMCVCSSEYDCGDCCFSLSLVGLILLLNELLNLELTDSKVIYLLLSENWRDHQMTEYEVRDSFISNIFSKCTTAH